MEYNNILTLFSQYKKGFILASFLLLLTACGDFSPIDETSTGFFNEYIVYPFSLLIKGIASVFNGSYGIAIVIITLGLRFLMLPFMVKQQQSSAEAQEKMTLMKPEINAVQEQYKGRKTMEEQRKMQEDLQKIYEAHDFQPGKMLAGCLPIFLQMPILIGFYYAIRRTPEIAEQTFLWFSLGETDFLLVFLAVFVYFLQGRVSLIGVDRSNQGPMAMMMYVSPVMIGLISLTTPAALPLYWVVSGLFMIGQTLLIKRYMLNVKRSVQ